MGMIGSGLFAYVLMWGTMSDPKFKGFEDRQLSVACVEAKNLEKEGATLFRVTVAQSGMTYAVMCSTPRCAEPPAIVTVTKIRCKLVPETQRVVVSPESWQEAQ